MDSPRRMSSEACAMLVFSCVHRKIPIGPTTHFTAVSGRVDKWLEHCTGAEHLADTGQGLLMRRNLVTPHTRAENLLIQEVVCSPGEIQ